MKFNMTKGGKMEKIKIGGTEHVINGYVRNAIDENEFNLDAIYISSVSKGNQPL